MKNVFILIFGIFSLIPSTTTLQEPVSSVVNVSVPRGAVKLNHSEMVANLQKMSKVSELKSVKSKNLFKVNDALLAFWDLEVTEGNAKSLPAIKSEVLELYKLDQNIVVKESKIIKMNDQNFLILKYRNGDSNYIRFISDYRKNRAFTGVLQFEDAKMAEADYTLNSLIKSVRFK